MLANLERSNGVHLQAAMLSWKAGQSQILVATDVAARGLHIKSLPYVINYDFPTNLDTYVHRVGRTGRLATDGHAYSFLTRNLAPIAKPLLDLLKVYITLMHFVAVHIFINHLCLLLYSSC